MADLVFKQVVAVIDNRTTMTCLRAAGQIAKVDEPFEVLTGNHDRPPFHWGCRSTVAPWVPGMINEQKALANEEIKKRPRSERRFGPDGYEGKIPGTPPPPPRPPQLPSDLSEWMTKGSWMAEISSDEIKELARLRELMLSPDKETRLDALRMWGKIREGHMGPEYDVGFDNEFRDLFIEFMDWDPGASPVEVLTAPLRAMNDFTPDEIEAMAGWIGADHPEVAFRLRGLPQFYTQTPEWDERARVVQERLDSAFAVAATPERKEFYRGMVYGHDGAVTELPRVGDTFMDESFSSFTSSPTTAMDYAMWDDMREYGEEEGMKAVVVRWDAPEGSKAIPIESVTRKAGLQRGPTDNEWLVDRSMKFRVKSVRKARPKELSNWDDEPGGYIVDVEVIE